MELVTEYEESHGWEDAGIHEGLVLGREELQDLPRFLLDGQSLEQFGATGTVLLGCTCGNIDDGPFFGTVQVTDNHVTWRDFRNPLASGLDWDYSDLGPFVFDRAQYDQAITDAMAEALGLGRQRPNPGVLGQSPTAQEQRSSAFPWGQSLSGICAPC